MNIFDIANVLKEVKFPSQRCSSRQRGSLRDICEINYRFELELVEDVVLDTFFPDFIYEHVHNFY